MKKCLDCGSDTNSGLDFCRNCLKQKWEYSKSFIKNKHNPYYLPMPMPTFRSVVTTDFITDKSVFIQSISENGIFYTDNRYKNVCCFLNQAIGNTAGSAIPANYPMPTYPLDSLLVVDAYTNPHVFAVDYSNFSKEISKGRMTPIIWPNYGIFLP